MNIEDLKVGDFIAEETGEDGVIKVEILEIDIPNLFCTVDAHHYGNQRTERFAIYQGDDCQYQWKTVPCDIEPCSACGGDTWDQYICTEYGIEIDLTTNCH